MRKGRGVCDAGTLPRGPGTPARRGECRRPGPYPLSSSGGGWLEVGLAVSEHGVEDVAAAPGEGDQGFVVALVLGDLVVVVGPGDGVAQGRECGQEEGSFEDLVPAAGWG